MPRFESLLSSALVILAHWTLAGCSTSSATQGDTAGVVEGEGGAGSSIAAPLGGSSSTAAGASVGVEILPSEEATPEGNGAEELCNGIDDDENGIVDDRDVGNDGVCDCIRIGTIGIPGVHGQGDVFATWLATRASDGAHALGDGEITSAWLSALSVVVIQDVYNNGNAHVYSEAEALALADWVAGGGGLMTVIGYATSPEVSRVNALLASFGMAYDDIAILQKISDTTRPVTVWNPNHPVSDSILAIGVDNGYSVSGGTIIATEEDNNGPVIVGAATEYMAGRVFVWGDEWITYNTEWEDHADYQVELFWLNILKWLTPAKECQVDIPPEIYVF